MKMQKRLLCIALALVLAVGNLPVVLAEGEPSVTSTIGIEPGYANEIQQGESGYQNGYHTYTFPELEVTQPGNQPIKSVVVQFSRAIQSGDAIQAANPAAAGITSVSAGGWVTNCVLTSASGLTAQQWQDYLRQNLQVRLTNTSAVVRSLRFSVSVEQLNSVYHYNEDNGHYYLAVPTAVNWPTAYQLASQQSYLGRQGYLVTVTSQAEHDFVYSLIGTNCWTGATCLDQYTGHPGSYGSAKADYYWVTGPEAGQLMWSGAYAQSAPNNPDSSKMYTNWSTGEPNNSNGEQCMHFYSSMQGKWNDYSQNTNCAYVVEFGGLEGDSEGVTDTSSTTDMALDMTGKTLGVNCSDITYGGAVVPSTTVNGKPFEEEVIYTYYKKQPDGSFAKIEGAPSDAGTYKVEVTKPDDATYTGSSKTFTIYPKVITAADLGISPTVKPYDGTNQFLGSVSISAAVAGDELSVQFDSSSGYNSSEVADADTITLTGLTLAGAAAGNYTLEPDRLEVAGSITPREVWVGPTADPSEKKVGEAIPRYGVQWLQKPSARDAAADPFARPVSDLGTPSFTCQNSAGVELSETSPAGTYYLCVVGFTDGSDIWQNPNYQVHLVNPATVVVTQDRGEYQITGERKNNSGWFTGPVTAAPTAESDYRQIADLLAGSPAVWGSEQIITGDGLHQLQLQLKKEDTGAVTDPADEVVKIDATAPVLDEDRDISTAYRDGKSHPVLPPMDGFERVYNTPIDLLVHAADATSGLASIQYALHATADPAEVYTPAAQEWRSDLTPDGSGKIAIPFTSDFRGIVYLKAVDVAGNETVVACPLLVDLTPPAVSGAQNGGIYYVKKDLQVSDFNLQQVIVIQDGVIVHQATAGQGQERVDLTLPSGEEPADYTVLAYDKAGHVTEYKVSTRPIGEIPAPIEDVTVDTVTGDDREEIESVKEKAEEVKNDPDASEEQKKELQEIIDNCDELLDKLDEVKEKIEEVKKPDGGSEPLDPGAVDKENKDDAQQVVDKIEDLLDEEDSHLTEEERKELEDLVDQLEDAIGEVEEVEQLEEDVRQLPEDLRDATSEEQKDILDRYSQLSEHQKEMMDPALRERIEALVVYTGDASSPLGWGLLAALGGLVMAVAGKRRREV